MAAARTLCPVHVHVEYPAPLHVPGTPSGSRVTLPTGATLSCLLDHLGIEPRHQPHVAAFVEGERIRASSPLQDGDRVVLQVPISGG